MTKEVWKDIREYKGLYQVSNLGRVKSLSRTYTRTIKGTTFKQNVKERILKQGESIYPLVNLYKKGKNKVIYIHTLVTEAFLGKKRKGLVVNHKDGNRNNNNIKNLEYCTQKENMIHARETGLTTIQYGEDTSGAKLTEQQVLEIHELAINKTYTQKEIGKMYGIDGSQVSRIKNKIYWRHLWE